MPRMQMDKYSAEAAELHSSVKAAVESATKYNAREALFGAPLTDYGAARKLLDTLEPFHSFWTTAARCALVAAEVDLYSADRCWQAVTLQRNSVQAERRCSAPCVR